MKKFFLIAIFSLIPVSSVFAQCNPSDFFEEVDLLELQMDNCPVLCSLDPLLDEVEIFKLDILKCNRGNMSACGRAQTSLKTIKDLAQEVRVCIAQDSANPTPSGCASAQAIAKNVKDLAQELRVCITKNF